MNGRKTFRVDRSNRKWMGVCAGIANHTGIDVTFVRLGVVALTLLGGFPWTLIAYFAIAYLARPKAGDTRDERASLRTSTRQMQASMRDIDRRMVEIDSYVAGSNSRLSVEIEQLR